MNGRRECWAVHGGGRTLGGPRPRMHWSGRCPPLGLHAQEALPGAQRCRWWAAGPTPSMPHWASSLEHRVSSPAWKTDLHLPPRNRGTMDVPGESAAELPARQERNRQSNNGISKKEDTIARAWGSNGSSHSKGAIKHAVVSTGHCCICRPHRSPFKLPFTSHPHCGSDKAPLGPNFTCH